MRKMMMAFGLAGALLAGAPALAQDKWPTDTLTMIVPFAAGGAVDFSARLLQEKLAERLGVTVVVENRAGGATVPATEYLVHAKPDGSVIGVFASALVANTVLLKDVPYDPTTDIAPISRTVKNTTLVVVQPDSRFKSIADLVEAAKAEPGEISYLSSGAGTAQHLAAELFQMQAGIELNHVPYQGAGPALNDMLGGQAELAFLGIGPVFPQMQDGKLGAIGITTSPRSPILPDVPTVAEQGYPDYSYGEWFAVIAPKDFPPELAERLHAELVAIAQDPDYRKRLEDLGLEAEATTPQELADFIVSEKKRILEIATEGNFLPK